jgi:hypothetical protein
VQDIHLLFKLSTGEATLTLQSYHFTRKKTNVSWKLVPWPYCSNITSGQIAQAMVITANKWQNDSWKKIDLKAMLYFPDEHETHHS